MLNIRQLNRADFARVVQLNADEVDYTSAMDDARLRFLLSMTCYAKVVEIESQVVAFLLAFRHGADYENDNFNWFNSRFVNFVYVDRIVVDARFSGQGLGSALYRDLFEFSRSLGMTHITCEYNIQPPNPTSKLFHDKFGFVEVGTQWVANGSKLVSLQLVIV